MACRTSHEYIRLTKGCFWVNWTLWTREDEKGSRDRPAERATPALVRSEPRVSGDNGKTYLRVFRVRLDRRDGGIVGTGAAAGGERRGRLCIASWFSIASASLLVSPHHHL